MQQINENLELVAAGCSNVEQQDKSVIKEISEWGMYIITIEHNFREKVYA